MKLVLVLLVSLLAAALGKKNWKDIDLDALEKQWEEGDDPNELKQQHELDDEIVCSIFNVSRPS